MAEETNQDASDEREESTAEQPKTSSKKRSLRRFLTRKWIAIVIGLSVIVHGVGFTYYHFLGKSQQPTPGPEISLGVFRFEANKNEGGRVANAEFSLAIALLDRVDQAARLRLKDFRFRVQQDVEELLRQAKSGDFENDAHLGDLKRQLQAQINDTLGMRVIADVIITDLKLIHTDRDADPIAETVLWVEEPAG